MAEKILGYFLLIIGVVAILYSGWSVYNVFTKKNKPVQLFNFDSISIDTSQIGSNNLNIDLDRLPRKIASLVQQNSGVTTKPQETKIIPAELINETSNVFAHLMLMGFIASISFKIATLGTSLVRPINVKIKQ